MTPQQKPKKKRPILLITIFIIVLIAVGAVAYFGFFKSSGGDRKETGSDVSDTGKDRVIDIPELNTKIISEETLNLFKIWNVIPVEVSTTGRSNPFSLENFQPPVVVEDVEE